MAKVAGKDLKPGDKVAGLWFMGDDGPSILLGVRPYTGIYPQHFMQIGKFQSNTKSGSLEMALGNEMHEVVGTIA